MANFIGTDKAIALQKRILDRQAVIEGDVNLVNGGRLMHFLDPNLTGWETVEQYATEDQLAGFPAVQLEETIHLIRKNLGIEWKTPIWQCLTGEADHVLDNCYDVISENPLPNDWHFSVLEHPGDDQVSEIQCLNSETGVSPYPAYYLRSEALPVLTVTIMDGDHNLVATASVADRYHHESRLGGFVFAGNVSVSSRCRGKGLGKFVNALALIESQKRFNWEAVTEQVSAENPVSRAMILSCGLNDTAGLVSIAASKGEEPFTK